MPKVETLCQVCKNQRALYLVTVFHRTSGQPCTSLPRHVCSGSFDRVEEAHREQKLPKCNDHRVEVGMSHVQV